jgi:hypothetical protein
MGYIAKTLMLLRQVTPFWGDRSIRNGRGSIRTKHSLHVRVCTSLHGQGVIIDPGGLRLRRVIGVGVTWGDVLRTG